MMKRFLALVTLLVGFQASAQLVSRQSLLDTSNGLRSIISGLTAGATIGGASNGGTFLSYTGFVFRTPSVTVSNEGNGLLGLHVEASGGSGDAGGTNSRQGGTLNGTNWSLIPTGSMANIPAVDWLTNATAALTNHGSAVLQSATNYAAGTANNVSNFVKGVSNRFDLFSVALTNRADTNYTLANNASNFLVSVSNRFDLFSVALTNRADTNYVLVNNASNFLVAVSNRLDLFSVALTNRAATNYVLVNNASNFLVSVSNRFDLFSVALSNLSYAVGANDTNFALSLATNYIPTLNGLGTNLTLMSPNGGPSRALLVETNALIVTNGAVGIGLTAPTNTLDVQGHTSLRSNIWLPTIGSNNAPVAFLGVDASGKVQNTYVPSAGGGEANVNGEVSVTNSTRIGLVNGKSSVTNLLRSVQGGNGITLTNQGTNIMVAIDPVVVASQVQADALSNRVVNLEGATNGLNTRAANAETTNATQTAFMNASTVALTNLVGTITNNAGFAQVDTTQFTTNNNRLNVKNGALLTNINIRAGLNLPTLTASRVLALNGSGDVTNSTGVDTTELEYLDGVTSALQTQLDGKQNGLTNGNQFGASTTLTLKSGLLITNVQARGLTPLGLTASRVMVVDASGNATNSQAVDTIEIEYLDGVTSAIQTQIDGKQAGLTNANQFGATTTITVKNGALLTNISVRAGLALPTLTASRVAVIDANNNTTNVTTSAATTDFVHADGSVQPALTNWPVATNLFATVPAASWEPGGEGTGDGGRAAAAAGTNASTSGNVTINRGIFRMSDSTNSNIQIALSLGRNFAGLIWAKVRYTTTNAVMNGNTNVIWEFSASPRATNDQLTPAYIYTTNVTTQFKPNASNSYQVATVPLLTITNWSVDAWFDFRLSRLGTNVGFARTNGLMDVLGVELYGTFTNGVVNANAP